MGVKKTSLRQQVVFSEELRKHIVSQIEKGVYTVSEARRTYDIKSVQTVYNWLYKYSRSLQKGVILVKQKSSEEKKRQDLVRKNKELEAALGRKQMELEALQELVRLASKELGVDLKKSYGKE
jgi:transposase-like protein